MEIAQLPLVWKKNLAKIWNMIIYELNKTNFVCKSSKQLLFGISGVLSKACLEESISMFSLSCDFRST